MFIQEWALKFYVMLINELTRRSSFWLLVNEVVRACRQGADEVMGWGYSTSTHWCGSTRIVGVSMSMFPIPFNVKDSCETNNMRELETDW